MKRILPFGAVVLVACGLGILPMIGCLAAPQEEQESEDVDLPLTSEARISRGACGTDGLRCCARNCCVDGSVCALVRTPDRGREHGRERGREHVQEATCMQQPPPGAKILRSPCLLQ